LGKIVAATHSGSFHADDVTAYVVLRLALGDQLEFFRSRDQERLKTAAIVFDVGGVYDPAQGRFDHHMRDKPLRTTGQPYSSAGLIWASMGRRALVAQFPQASPAVIERLWEKFDQDFILDIDLIDNGLLSPGQMDYSVLVSQFNNNWDQPEDPMAFFAAADFAQGIMIRRWQRMYGTFAAEQIVLDAYKRSSDKRVLYLDHYVPYESVVFANELPILYAVYESGNQWRINALPPEKGSFDQRCPLPQEWGGLAGDELASVCGIPDAEFCHPNLFTCGAKSRNGILTMLAFALKNAK
jgi:uncharacterized UPF0160 family protein